MTLAVTCGKSADGLARRLDWLISGYLLAEDLAAADWLTQLRARLQQEE